MIAFDTGPGNMVIDALAAEYTEGKQTLRPRRPHRRAGQREPDRCWTQLLADPYYRAEAAEDRGPRAVWRGIRGAAARQRMPMPDLIATATALTAATIAIGIRRFAG